MKTYQTQSLNSNQSIGTPFKQQQTAQNTTLQRSNNLLDSMPAFVDNRPTFLAQRKIQDLVERSPQAQKSKSFLAMVNNSIQPKAIIEVQPTHVTCSYNIQRAINKGKKRKKTPTSHKVSKYRAARWFTPYDPYTIFSTQALAKVYHDRLKTSKRPLLKARVPTLYTYTHTKSSNLISSVPQGPHSIAHRVTLEALLKVTTVVEAKKTFDEQVPDIAGVKKILKDERTVSKKPTDLDKRFDNYLRDYENLYQRVTLLFADSSSDLIDVKDSVNQLLNLHPYAAYSWKTTTNASRASLKAKAENIAIPDWDKMHDAGGAKRFNSKRYTNFLTKRKKLFNFAFP